MCKGGRAAFATRLATGSPAAWGVVEPRLRRLSSFLAIEDDLVEEPSEEMRGGPFPSRERNDSIESVGLDAICSDNDRGIVGSSSVTPNAAEKGSLGVGEECMRRGEGRRTGLR